MSAVEDGREWSCAGDSGLPLGTLLACSACVENSLWVSEDRAFHTDLSFMASQAFHPSCVFSRTSLLTVQVLPFWEMGEGRAGKRCSCECIKPGRAGAVGTQDPHSSACLSSLLRKEVWFRREFYSFRFVLVGGWLVSSQVNTFPIPEMGKYEEQLHWGQNRRLGKTH